MSQHILPLDTLGPGQIALCLHRFTDFSHARIDTLQTLLSAQERERNASFKQRDHQHRGLICRGLLREYLASLLNCPPADIILSANENGKPALIDGQAAIQFNYSHSGEYVVFAFCAGSAIGVDIEWTRRRNTPLRIAQHFFSADEVHALETLPESSLQSHFFRYWTLKEAYLKARGEGIFLGLDKFSFRLHPTDESDLSIAFCNAEFDQPEHWQFHSLTPLPEYRVSVAVRHALPKFSLALHQ